MDFKLNLSRYHSSRLLGVGRLVLLTRLMSDKLIGIIILSVELEAERSGFAERPCCPSTPLAVAMPPNSRKPLVEQECLLTQMATSLSQP
jgi:hypothetical protein